MEELWARDFSSVLYFRTHRLLTDLYCLQHPESHCAGEHSLAAHLVGLCIALEHDDDPELMKGLQRWLSTKPRVEHPAVPSTRGALTVADVPPDLDPLAHRAAVVRWARAVWEAYAPLHETARGWLRRSRTERRA